MIFLNSLTDTKPIEDELKKIEGCQFTNFNSPKFLHKSSDTLCHPHKFQTWEEGKILKEVYENLFHSVEWRLVLTKKRGNAFARNLSIGDTFRITRFTSYWADISIKEKHCPDSYIKFAVRTGMSKTPDNFGLFPYEIVGVELSKSIVTLVCAAKQYKL